MNINLANLPSWAKLEVSKEDLVAFANQITDNCKSRAMLPTEAPTEIMNVDEAAELLDLAKQTIYQLSSQRKLPSIKKNKRLYFKRSQLLAWLEEGQQKTEAEVNDEVSSYLARKRK